MPRRSAFVLLLLLLTTKGTPASAQQDAQTLAIAPTHTQDVDAVVGRFVDRALARTAAMRGYAVLDEETVRVALARLGAEQPPAIADLIRLSAASSAPCSVSAIAGAHGGRYTLQVRVGCRDGSGPYYASGEAGQTDLEAVASRLLAQALPQALSGPATAPAPAPLHVHVHAPEEASPTPTRTSTPTPAPTPVPPRFRLAIHDDLDVGLAEDPFVSNILGVRFDIRIFTATWAGFHLGYANLPSSAGRAQNVLPYAQIEQRIPLTASGFAIPLRVALGYLPKNGAYLRISSGLAIPLTDRTDLVLDLVGPTFLSTPDKTLFALAFGVEASVEL